MIVNGASVSTIAESRNVAIDTVKSQLKSSYRKTGCKSRVELARLALKADPPVR
jgi:DNA-binding CsgD family transcriptional regulator